MTERQVLERERDEDQRTSGDTGKNHTPWTKVRDKAWENEVLDNAAHGSIHRYPQTDGSWTQTQPA
jgi:hypothetical protein